LGPIRDASGAVNRHDQSAMLKQIMAIAAPQSLMLINLHEELDVQPLGSGSLLPL